MKRMSHVTPSATTHNVPNTLPGHTVGLGAPSMTHSTSTLPAYHDNVLFCQGRMPVRLALDRIVFTQPLRITSVIARCCPVQVLESIVHFDAVPMSSHVLCGRRWTYEDFADQSIHAKLATPFSGIKTDDAVPIFVSRDGHWSDATWSSPLAACRPHTSMLVNKVARKVRNGAHVSPSQNADSRQRRHEKPRGASDAYRKSVLSARRRNLMSSTVYHNGPSASTEKEGQKT